MSTTQEANDAVLAAVLDAWDRNNTTLLNLLRAIPADALALRALPGSPTIAEIYTHMHHERMVSVLENAPEAAGTVPAREWIHDTDVPHLVALFDESAARVRDAVLRRTADGRAFDADFAHPVQLMTFLIFHEGYHHGQVKLALKAGGRQIPDEVIGSQIWDVWRGR